MCKIEDNLVENMSYMSNIKMVICQMLDAPFPTFYVGYRDLCICTNVAYFYRNARKKRMNVKLPRCDNQQHN